MTPTNKLVTDLVSMEACYINTGRPSHFLVASLNFRSVTGFLGFFGGLGIGDIGIMYRFAGAAPSAISVGSVSVGIS